MSPEQTKTPLAKKLGLEEGFDVLLYNVPGNYGDLLGDLPMQLNFLESVAKESADFIHLFCNTEKELQQNLKKYVPALRKTGLLWLSWPRESSNISSDLDRNSIRDYILANTDLVDTKVAAIDEDWNGLKFVYHLEVR
jgi:hypothetical protein